MLSFRKKKSLADELREAAARAPQKKREEKLKMKRERMDQAIRFLYQVCREEAQLKANEGKHEARVGTGYAPKNRYPEDEEILSVVLKKLRQVDKLKAHMEVVESTWVSDDTGENFIKETLVIVMNW
jgi:hypothetical protein